MTTDLLYQLALCQVPHIGNVHAKILADRFQSAQAVFNASKSSLEHIEGIGEVRARSIKMFRDFNKAEKEIAFIEKYMIKALFLQDKDYPQRLLNCYDPPTILFYKGKANLNSGKIIAIVGTRNNTGYGKQSVEKLVKDLVPHNVLIVSGLAFGIDSIAHKAAISNKMPTVGVVGHGLDTIYPRENLQLAKEMLKEGGILTEFRSNTKPDKHNFPSRNRVVAGISDATIIVESGLKGGSLITADIAGSYNRDVFAVPGRLTDPKSDGCNQLIRNNKAILLNDAVQLAEVMGWSMDHTKTDHLQKKLFTDLSVNEKMIVDLLQEKGPVSIDELNLACPLSMSAIAAAILNLEMQYIIQCLPGKIYRVIP